MNAIDLSLTNAAPEDAHLPRFAEAIVDGILKTVRSFPGGAARLYWACEQSGAYRLLIVPLNNDASKVEVEINLDRPSEVSVQMGAASYICLETDTYGFGQEQWPSFVADLVGAIMHGKLEEELTYKGGVLVRSKLRVDLEGRPFRFSRSNLPLQLKTMFRQKEIKAVRFAPYAAAG